MRSISGNLIALVKTPCGFTPASACSGMHADDFWEELFLMESLRRFIKCRLGRCPIYDPKIHEDC